jgi:peptidoglycan/xylan/chitin deacetylase (PgdA/CDA1 family)
MFGFKESFFLFSTPLIKLFSVPGLTKITGNKIILPFYHSVCDQHLSHLSHLYPVKNIKQFNSELDQLLKFYKPISLKELISHNVQDKNFTTPVFHLTFDDGLSQFNDLASDILLKKGIPATCFLNSSFIGNKDLFFRYKASLLIDNLHHQAAGSEAWKNFHEWSKKNNLPKLYYKKLLLSIGFERKELLDELAMLIGVDFNEYLKLNKPYLDEVQIRSLITKGFTFGAHSIDHPEYRFLNEEEQIRQTKESVNSICNQFNLDYKVFSFPFTDFGVKKSFFDFIYKEKVVDITFGCAGIKIDTIKRNLQRIPVELYNLSLIETLKRELIYFLFNRLINQHKIRRQ